MQLSSVRDCLWLQMHENSVHLSKPCLLIVFFLVLCAHVFGGWKTKPLKCSYDITKLGSFPAEHHRGAMGQ